MTVRPEPGQRLPELVWVAHQVVLEEAEALRSALEAFSNSPQPGCPFELDRSAWSPAAGPHAEARGRLFGLAVHQAVLIYINAYDHMLTLGRALGGDGATTLFAHASLSRVVCEAAVRFAWILDSGISCEERTGTPAPRRVWPCTVTAPRWLTMRRCDSSRSGTPASMSRT